MHPTQKKALEALSSMDDDAANGKVKLVIEGEWNDIHGRFVDHDGTTWILVGDTIHDLLASFEEQREYKLQAEKERRQEAYGNDYKADVAERGY